MRYRTGRAIYLPLLAALYTTRTAEGLLLLLCVKVLSECVLLSTVSRPRRLVPRVERDGTTNWAGQDAEEEERQTEMGWGRWDEEEEQRMRVRGCGGTRRYTTRLLMTSLSCQYSRFAVYWEPALASVSWYVPALPTCELAASTTLMTNP